MPTLTCLLKKNERKSLGLTRDSRCSSVAGGTAWWMQGVMVTWSPQKNHPWLVSIGTCGAETHGRWVPFWIKMAEQSMTPAWLYPFGGIVSCDIVAKLYIRGSWREWGHTFLSCWKAGHHFATRWWTEESLLHGLGLFGGTGSAASWDNTRVPEDWRQCLGAFLNQHARWKRDFSTLPDFWGGWSKLTNDAIHL